MTSLETVKNATNELNKKQVTFTLEERIRLLKEKRNEILAVKLDELLADDILTAGQIKSQLRNIAKTLDNKILSLEMKRDGYKHDKMDTVRREAAEKLLNSLK